jgi:arsenate reductase
MTGEVTIYYNPRCSKSRATLELLREQGIEPNIIEYLKTPPSRAELTRILNMLGMEPRELMRSKETEYREQGLDNPDLKQKDLVKAMHDTPKIMERPIVVANGKAALGRPPEQVLEILD